MTTESESPRLPSQGPNTSIQTFVDIVASLRGPDGCPWDRAQTHESLAPYAVEETHELVDAIASADVAAICEELGDVLLQIVLHAQLAAEEGHFVMQEVIDGISAKMVRRHPHVFGDERAKDPAAVEARWKEAKRSEGRTVLGGVPQSMPPLARGLRLTQRAASVGFDWPDVAGASTKLDEELSELRHAIGAGDHDPIEDELGDVLFCVVNLARKLDVDPERALARTLAKFERRFAYIEGQLEARGRSADESTLEEMDALWEAAKGALERDDA